MWYYIGVMRTTKTTQDGKGGTMKEIKDMTDAELRAASRRCGSGFDPYDAELERREFAARETRTPSLAEQRDSLLREIERKDCAAARESGTFDAEHVANLRAQVADIDAKISRGEV